MSENSATVVERLKASLESASAHNPNDAEKPVAVLWTDRDAQWRPILARLRALMPQLLVLGEYEPENRTGPSIWLRCVVDRVLELPGLASDTTPVVYLPDVSRQTLGSAEACPSNLKPLVELQYRGTCWTQKNGRDWTVEAFMVSSDGGLGLDVARDTVTRQSMLGALPELATTSIRLLEGRRLEANDFDALFSDDPIRDLLLWLSEPESVLAGWEAGRRSAFTSRCKSDFRFDPDKDGALFAAERLGRREGSWGSVWSRFAESPALYTGLPELLRKAMPNDLFVEPPSSWPQNNEKGEAELRRALQALEGKTPSAAREEVIKLEKTHGPRREWVWAKLDLAPLARAILHLAEVAERTSRELGGVSPAEMAAQYAAGAWTIDAAALSCFVEVSSSADANAVSRALNAIYRPWLDAAARHLQALADQEPLPRHGEQISNDIRVDSGSAILFADGLRLDVSQRLVERLQSKRRPVEISTRWAAHPTVTATAKPAVSPVSDHLGGASLDAEFRIVTADVGRPLSTDRFRKLLDASGYQYLSADDTGDPSGRAWTEYGDLDKLGHSLQATLAARIDEQIALLLERIESLLDAGWREVRVVTDHGWLWLPGGLPKVDLPKYLTKSRWARCASIEGGSTVQVPTVPWYWNAAERVAVGPGIACFGAGNEYAHGGLSLQESLIPVLRVTAGSVSATVEASITAVTWVGLRCRVRINPPRPELSVDLRTRVNDPDSSASEARQVDAEGAASLLVADDELEGRPAAVVVLGPSGQVVARQSTIIGGED
ncbi:MAG: BREX-1 system phosphatase PglZ type B [Gammaproteobacteria bacterium]|nr:BREX-1 system phosphatase PglZ type B [Gammaproteobacteria bacterium]